MTLEQALMAAVVTLGGVVAGLFAWFKTQFGLILSKLSDCETDREALWARLAGIEERKKDKTENFPTPPIRRNPKRQRR